MRHLLLSLLLVSAAQAEEPLEFGASLRTNGAAYAKPRGAPLLPDGALGVVETRVRPTATARSHGMTLGAAVELKALHTSNGAGSLGRAQGGGSPLGSGSVLERFDWTWDHHDERQTLVRTRIERLDLAGSVGRLDWDTGRQPVSLGTSHFIGVLDVLAPFAPGDLDSTYKPGVDAARARTGLGDEGEAEVIAAAALPWGRGALVGRVRESIGSTDVELLGGRFRRRAFGGAGFESGAGSLGLWGEAALFQRRLDVETFRGGWTEAAFSAAAGLEWRPAANTLIGLAGLYQDFGVRRSRDLASVALDAPYREGWAFLASQGYAALSLHRKLHPLVDADASAFFNLVDGSTLWQPRLSVSLSDDSDAVLFGWLGTGPAFGSDGLPRSEFGASPDGGGLYFRWFL